MIDKPRRTDPKFKGDLHVAVWATELDIKWFKVPSQACEQPFAGGEPSHKEHRLEIEY